MAAVNVPSAAALGLSPDAQLAEERALLEEQLHEIQNRKDYWTSPGLQRQAADAWTQLYPGKIDQTNRGPSRR